MRRASANKTTRGSSSSDIYGLHTFRVRNLDLTRVNELFIELWISVASSALQIVTQHKSPLHLASLSASKGNHFPLFFHVYEGIDSLNQRRGSKGFARQHHAWPIATFKFSIFIASSVFSFSRFESLSFVFLFYFSLLRRMVSYVHEGKLFGEARTKSKWNYLDVDSAMRRQWWQELLTICNHNFM